MTTASASQDDALARTRLRIRSPEELAIQNRGLVELSHLLEEKGIRHYLSSGTLLGAVREGNFIPWDWDVQFYFRLEDVAGRFDELLAAMQMQGFESKKLSSEASSWKIVVLKYGTEYEMTAWQLKGAMRVRSMWNLPARFFEDPDIIEFLGREYFCMTPAEEYLEFCYGEDWRTPKRIDKKEDYLAPNFYRSPLWWRDLKSLVMKFFSRCKRLLLGRPCGGR